MVSMLLYIYILIDAATVQLFDIQTKPTCYVCKVEGRGFLSLILCCLSCD